jgi:hypothetical protein
MAGTLIGIGRRTARRAPMLKLEAVTIAVDIGLTGDTSGPRHPKRLVTVLAIEDWTAALVALNARDLVGGIDLDRAAR